MNKFQAAYVPIGVPTFHLESAGEEFRKSKELLASLSGDVVMPEEMLLTMDKLKAFLDTVAPDLIILQNITFANAAYASEVLHRFSCPVLLWTLREPVIDGGRLRLNSLTGAFSAGNAIRAFRKEPFPYIFGSPEEDAVKRDLSAALAAAKLKHQLKQVRLAAVGHTPEGFGFGRALDLDMLSTFGVTMESIEARELIERAKAIPEDKAQAALADASTHMCGLSSVPEKNQVDFARLSEAYQEYVREHKIDVLASRCWPDFFTSYGTPVCAVLAMLNDLGIAAACESDAYGALSMYCGMQLSGRPVFFGDPVSMDEKDNTITFWHCGTAACSLARNDTGAAVGVHCNRKIGPTMEFGCKAWPEATIFRIGRKPDGSFRFFLASGEVLDRPKQFSGTSLVVHCSGSAEHIVKDSVRDGWEPHFVVIYGDSVRELTMLADMYGITCYNYS